MKSFYVMGVDLGGTADSSGLAVVEGVRSDYDRQQLKVPYLHSFPPGTGYTEIIDHVLEAIDHVTLACIMVDQTAVGAPIVNMIRRDVPIKIAPVIIRGHSESSSDGVQFIPRQTLISGVTVGLTDHRLHISKDLKETPNLIRELRGYQNRPTSASSLLADTWRDRPSDDLVFAVALACWKLEQPEDFQYGGPLW